MAEALRRPRAEDFYNAPQHDSVVSSFSPCWTQIDTTPLSVSVSVTNYDLFSKIFIRQLVLCIRNKDM